MSRVSSQYKDFPQAILEIYEQERPDIVSLAMLASLARKIEPELLRALRLKLSYYFEKGEKPTVGTESALWFSSLVESRGADSITLLPGVTDILRARLKTYTEILKEAHLIIRELHKDVPPVINWEEDLIYYGLSPELNEQARNSIIKQTTLKAFNAIKNGERADLEELIVDISQRLPEEITNQETFAALLSLSQSRIIQYKALSDSNEDFPTLPETFLQIKRNKTSLYLGEEVSGAEYEIKIPDLRPLTIRISSPSKPFKKYYRIPNGKVINVPVIKQSNEVFIHTLSGKSYRIALPEPRIPDSIYNRFADKFKYDVFLSYSSRDRAVMQKLAQRLVTDGVRVWLDSWEIKLGDSIPLRIEQGLEQSRFLILAMSENVFASEWASLERRTLLFRDPSNSERRFIPLLLEDCKIPDVLKQFAYVDWRQRDEEQYQQLLSAIRPLSESDGLSENTADAKAEVLTNSIDEVHAVAVTADGRLIASSSNENSVSVWDADTGKRLSVLKGHTSPVLSVATNRDGKIIAAGAVDKTIRIWEPFGAKCLAVLEGHTSPVYAVTTTADGKIIVSGSMDNTVRLWETAKGNCLAVFEGHTHAVYAVATTNDGRLIASSSADMTIRLWETMTGKCLAILKGHSDWVRTLAMTADGKLIVSGSDDKTIRIWETASGKCIAIFEGHTDLVRAVAVTADGKLIASGSADKTIRVWETESHECLGILKGHTDSVRAVAITADGELIVSGSSDRTLRAWESASFNYKGKKKQAENLSGKEAAASKYTNAKVLLVGDSGVGKSGLAIRLTEDRFAPTFSTDGVWATQFNLPHDANTADTEREIWLWDFAGQADYRLIHQLFMNETALAVLVFNPQQDNAFEGIREWTMSLEQASQRPFKKLLVAGRCDRGGLTIAQKSLADFMQERGFSAYYETSAKTGAGCDDLREAIVRYINWDDLPHTTSPRIFKLLKEEIIKLKDENRILLRFSELKQQLEMRLSGERFENEELRAVIGLLTGAGNIWELEFGDFVLLQPERINSYAAAVIRSVRAHVDEIGCIWEEQVLAGEFDYQDMQRLPEKEEKVVLQAMHETFVSRGLCLREMTERGVLLVFPSYFRRERPELEKHPSALVTYQFSGMLDEIYATLITKLHHTKAFEKDQLWRYAADFKTQANRRVGLKMTKKAEGGAEITVYFDREIPEDTKVTFIRYVHDHLYAKDPDLKRRRHYVCPHCETPFENSKAIEIRLNKGFKDILCPICEGRFEIVDLIEEKFASDEFRQRVLEMEEQAQILIDHQSKELILIGHAFSVAGEAGQIFRATPNSDWGIDGEIELKDHYGKASGKRIYLQINTADFDLRKADAGRENLFGINPRHAEYWLAQSYPVMLIFRNSNGQIYWANVTEHLKKHGAINQQIIVDSEPFTSLNLQRLQDSLLV